MDREYIYRRRRRNQIEYRIKVVVTIVIAFLAIGFAIFGVSRLVASSKNTGAQTPAGNNQQGTVPGTEGDITPEATPLPTSTPAPTPTPTPSVPKIAIDAGHGGEDLGSVRDGYYEKDINLAIALEVERLLKELGYETWMMRTDDATIETKKRPEITAEVEMDLFVSIHQNSLDNNTTTSGTEVWYNENNNSENQTLAKLIVKEVTDRTGSKNRGEKVGNSLIVLKTLEVPSCLIECGFISSDAERELLLTEEYQKKIAEGIVAGITEFLPLEEVE